MDIVPLKNRRRTQSRRHTTDVTLDELPSHTASHLSTSTAAHSSTSSSAISMDYYGGESLSQGNLGFVDEFDNSAFPKGTFTSSWTNLYDEVADRFDSDMPYYMGSQSDVFQELNELQMQNHHLGDMKHAHQYQLSYELALDNMLTPFASHVVPPVPQPPSSKSLSHISHVIHEIVTTERSYVKYLSEIVEGYLIPLETRVGVLMLSEGQLKSLFGNINEIRVFNRSLLEALLLCGHDAGKVGQCFLDKAEGFKIYTQYCTNYPNSVTVLSQLSKDPGVAEFLKTCQQRLNHMLPLGAFLLKPVQRVLKYSLLLGDMAKHMRHTYNGFDVVQEALSKMTRVAEHINDMKKKYDAAVHVQEIQSLIRGWEKYAEKRKELTETTKQLASCQIVIDKMHFRGHVDKWYQENCNPYKAQQLNDDSFDLSKCGDLVLEENFRYLTGRSSASTFRSGRTDRYIFLFQKLCLMTKKEEYGYQYKTHLEMKDIQLTEKVEKDRNCFQIRQVSTGLFYTLQASSLQVKEQWVKTIKLLLMESLPHLPDKAKLLILAGFPTDEPQRSPQRSDKFSGRAKGLSRTAGRFTKPVGPEKGLRNRRHRSQTSPSLSRAHMTSPRVTSPTHLLARSGLTGYLTATVHCPLDASESSMVEEEEKEDMEIVARDDESPLSIRQRDSGFSESILGTTDYDVRRQRRSPLADSRRSPFRENGNRDSPKRELTPDLKKYKSSIDEPEIRVSPKLVISRPTRHSTSPEQFDINGTVERCHSESPSQSIQTKRHGDPYSQETELPTKNGKHRKEAGELVNSTESQLQSASEMRNNQHGYITVSSSTEQLFNRDDELENESPPTSPVRLTRIDSVGSEGLAALTHDPIYPESNSLSQSGHFMSEIIEPPSMFLGGEGEVDQQADVTHLPQHCNLENKVTDQHEELFNELMNSTSESHYSASEDLEQGYNPPGSTLSRNSAEIVHTTLVNDNEHPQYKYEKTKSSEEFYLSHLERVYNEDTATPKASPCPVRHQAELSSDSDDLQYTPKSSPHVTKRVTSSKHASGSESSVEDVPQVIEPPFEFKASSSVCKSPVLPMPPHFGDETHPVMYKSKPVKSSSIVRRHSFGSRAQRTVLQQQQESHSTSSSPIGNPAYRTNRFKDQKSSTISVVRRNHSFNQPHTTKRPISVVGLLSTTRSDLSLEDLRSINVHQDTDVLAPSDTILPPPEQFVEHHSAPGQQAEQNFSGRKKHESHSSHLPNELTLAHSQSFTTQASLPKEKPSDQSPKTLFSDWFQKRRKKPKSLLSSGQVSSSVEKEKPTQHKHKEPTVQTPEREGVVKEPITFIPPYDENPEENLSFDEILASFDRYASATGNTTKSRSQKKENRKTLSPELKPKKKRRAQRSLTVANIDADTMKAVRESMQRKESPPIPPPSPRQAKTKVRKMAREYSRRIKDHHRRGIFKRHSTVHEDQSDSESPVVTKDPTWLQDLKERRQSNPSLSSQDELTPPAVPPSSNDVSTVPVDAPKAQDDSQIPHASHSRVEVEVIPKSSTLPRLDAPEDSLQNFSKPYLDSDSKDKFTGSRGGGFKGWVKLLVGKFSKEKQ